EYWSFLFKMKKKAQVVYSLLPENFILYFFSFIFVLFLASYCYSVIKHKGRTWDHSYTFLLLICAVPLGFYGFYYRRFQDEYMAEFMPPLVLTGAVGIDWLLLKIKPWLERKMQLFLLFLPAVLLGSVYALVFNYRYQWNNPHGGTHNLSAVYEAVDFVEKNAAQQEILTAAIIIPYLSDNPLAFRMSRPALFGYPQLASEIKHTLYPTDEEIIVGLRKKPISWVILDKTTRDSFFRGHPGIEKVLQKEYTVIKVVADEWTGTVYEIARRK
ncbi:MAG: hypothetical protein ACOC4Z_02895, partial [Patescibacteria group bacterium]